MATVRKAPSIEYNFQLVITRVFEEGEEDILEEEDESESSYIGHIRVYMRVSRSAYSDSDAMQMTRRSS